ncbi:hypothetical protein AC1031_012664 [Aphanomyces cochlioides]|nr:hypothetical protein AC1031_012664 [Aphanomyces cochlioides]
MEKAKVEKKGRFTIIDLPPDEQSPSSSLEDGLPQSPVEGRRDSVHDEFNDDIESRKPRIKQKGRFTIIDLDPNTPSPERGLRKGFRDDPVERTGDTTSISIPSTPVFADNLEKPLPLPAQTPPRLKHSVSEGGPGTQEVHNPACCLHRSSFLYPQATPGPPPCTILFPQGAPARRPSISSPQQYTHVAVPLQQYQSQQSLLAALVEQNREMRHLIDSLQSQQDQLLGLAQSLHALAPPLEPE